MSIENWTAGAEWVRHPIETMSAFPMYSGILSMDQDAVVDLPHGVADLPGELGADVVCHDYVRAHLGGGHGVCDVVHLHLDLEREGRLGDLLHRRLDGSAGANVVVLHEDHGVQVGPVGVSSGDRHRLLLERSEAGHGLAGGRDDQLPVGCFDRTGGERGDAAHRHEDVEGGPLGGDHAGQRPGYGHDAGTRLDAVPVPVHGCRVRADYGEDLLGLLDPGDDCICLAGDVRGAVGVRDGQARGDVALPDIGLEKRSQVHGHTSSSNSSPVWGRMTL